MMTTNPSTRSISEESALMDSGFRVDHLKKIDMFTMAGGLLIEGRALSKDEEACLGRVLSFVKMTIDASQVVHNTSKDIIISGTEPEMFENYRFFLSAARQSGVLGDKDATAMKEELLKKEMNYLKDIRDELDSVINFGNAGSCRQKAALIEFLVSMRAAYMQAKMIREYDRIGSPVF